MNDARHRLLSVAHSWEQASKGPNSEGVLTLEEEVMPYWRLFYHFNWATKRREPLITPDVELRLYGFLRKEAEKLLAPLVYINGMLDHLHVLVSVRPAISPAEVAQQLKGSGSHFMTHKLERSFEWQEDYGVLSVSEKDVPRVVEYIKNQKQHHAGGTLWEKFEEVGKVEL